MPENTEVITPTTPATITEEVSKQLKEIKDEHNIMMAEKDAKVAEQDAIIAQLKEEGVKLRRELIRKAVLDPPKEEMTDEEKRQEELKTLVVKTKKYIKFFT